MALRTFLSYFKFAVALSLAGAGVSEGVRRFASRGGAVAVAGGKCSAQDVDLMTSLGGGNGVGSFPEMAAQCGSKSWTLFRGWQDKKYTGCLSGKAGLSEQCSTCFSAWGKYGFQQCKGKCLRSWCAAECLECLEKDKATLVACSGTEPPLAPPCDGGAAALAEVEVVDAGGKCSTNDMAAMEERGAGHKAGSFPEIAAKCGKKAFSLFKGFQREVYNKCLAEGTSISAGCSTCFADSAQYGVQNCKSACWASWCSSKCLKCANENKGTLAQCVGATPPDASEC